MKFEKFKQYIDTIIKTREKEEKLAECIEQNLMSTSFCVVDISDEITSSLIDLLADYYHCYFDIQGIISNDIAWWLDNDAKEITITETTGEKKVIDLSTIKKFWQYLEENRQIKLKDKEE